MPLLWRDFHQPLETHKGVAHRRQGQEVQVWLLWKGIRRQFTAASSPQKSSYWWEAFPLQVIINLKWQNCSFLYFYSQILRYLCGKACAEAGNRKKHEITRWGTKMNSWNFFLSRSPRLSYLLVEDKRLICDGDEMSCWIFSGTDESGA